MVGSWARGAVLLAGLLVAGVVAAALPRPESLEPAVDFWKRIFTAVPTHGGLLHDARELDVVYEVVIFPQTMTPRDQYDRIEALKAEYRKALLALAEHPGDPATPLEHRLAELFGGRTSARTLRTAAKRLRFQRGLADRFRAGLVRSGRWLPHIRRELAERGVPPELAALPHVESSFVPYARSHAGAAGLWQFTSGTGRRYLRIDGAIDERLDPFRASEAAAQLLADNYAQLGHWPLAITAYNHGVNGMRRAVERLGTVNIGVIIERYDGPYFGFASRNFYPALLAAAEIERAPARYFGDLRRDPPAADDTVRLVHYLSAAAVVRALEAPGEILRALNPAVRDSVWSGNKYLPPGYQLRIPAVLAPVAERRIAAVPDDARYLAQRPSRTHRVGSGQTLSGIARRYDVTLEKLMAVNNLADPDHLRAGRRLKLPLAGREPLSVAAVTHVREEGVHVVEAGETLSAIARRFGASVADLVALNDLRNPDRLRVGQRLRLGESARKVAASLPGEVR